MSIKNGFTLVELLIVIALIATLVAILLPVMSSVLSQGVGTQCIANLHSYGLAFAQFRIQNNGEFPGGRPTASLLLETGNGKKIRPRYYALLGPYMTPPFSQPSTTDQRQTVDNPAFLCPAVEWTDERNFPYGYNYQFLGNNRNKLNSSNTINYPVKINQVTQPARTVLMADSMGTAANFATLDRKTYDAKSSDFDRLGNHAWTLDPPHLPAGSYVSANPDVAGNRSCVDPRHNGKAHVLFVDGHVDAMTPEELGYHLADDGKVLHDGDNKLFSGDGTDRLPPTAD